MRASIFFIAIFLFSSYVLTGQEISLSQGEVFFFNQSEYSDQLMLSDDLDQKQKWLADNQLQHFKNMSVRLEVLGTFEDHYKILATTEENTEYKRRKPKGSNWITYMASYKELRSIDSIPIQQIVFDLSFDGQASNFKDYRNNESNDNSSIKTSDFTQFIFPINTEVKIGQIIQRNEYAYKYKVKEKSKGLIKVSRIQEINDDKVITESLIVNEQGLVIDQTLYSSKQNIVNGHGYVQEKMRRSNLVNEFTEPYACIFEKDGVSKDTTFSKTNVRIRGRILTLVPGEEISLSWDDRPTNAYSRFQIKSIVDKAGYFELRASIDRLTNYKLNYGNNHIPIYLLPGDDIHVQMDNAKSSEPVKAFGIGADHVNFMFDKFIFERSNHLGFSVIRDGIYDKLLDLSPEEMKARCFGILSKKVSFLRDKIESLSPEVFLAEYWGYQLAIESVLREYHYNQRVHRKGRSDMPFDVNDQDYFDFDTLIHADNDLMIFANDYEHFIREYVYFYLDNKIEKITGVGKIVNHGREENFYNAEFKSRFYLAESSFSGMTEHVLKYKTIEDAIQRADWEVFDEFYTSFMNEYPYSSHSKLLNIAHQKAQTVQPGKQAFNFELPDFEGNIIRLSDFRGRVVYLNFWDPNCCSIYIEKYSEKMENIVEGKNIEIIYIALDSDAKTAKSHFENLDLKGTKVYANKKEQRLLMDQYYFTSLSHFIIIDTEGRMYDHTAPTPQSIIHKPELLFAALDPG